LTDYLQGRDSPLLEELDKEEAEVETSSPAKVDGR
ncbi:unnamed protein product, partial [marine sediment metagenome]